MDGRGSLASDVSFMEGQDQESLEMLRSLGYIK